MLGTADASLVPADLAVLVAHVAVCLDEMGEGIEAGDLVLADFGALGAVTVRFER